MSKNARQAMRDADTIIRRKQQCGTMFEVMKKRLSPWPKKLLLIEGMFFCSNSLAKGHTVVKPGRLENRRFDALICWFCEQHSDILLGNFCVDLSVLDGRSSSRSGFKSPENDTSDLDMRIPFTPLDVDDFW
jgi:hypothetical protein